MSATPPPRPPRPPSSPPSLASSYTQVMRLLLALLSDGLPCLSDKDSLDKETFETLQGKGREDNLVQVFKVAVNAIGSVSECRRLGMVVQGGGGLVSGGDGGGGGGGGGGGEAVGFSELLREALSLVTGAAWSNLVPLVQKGSCDARVSEMLLKSAVELLYRLAAAAAAVYSYTPFLAFEYVVAVLLYFCNYLFVVFTVQDT